MLFLLSAGVSAAPSDTLFLKLQQSPQAHVENLLSVFPADYPAYQLFIQSPNIRKVIKNHYDMEEFKAITQQTAETRKLLLTEKPWGTFIKATSFEDNSIKSETHYDAIWLRDSLWGYLALNSQKEDQASAKKVLLTLWDYMSTPAQLERMDNAISDPSLLNAEDGQMNAVHIRFDSNSAEFNDVLENGKPQQWNHKQNDALGLYLASLIQAIESGQISRSDWEKDYRLSSLIKLVAYLDKIQFYEMADSGAWEEDARLNTSSIALVTSGLERLINLLNNKSNSNAVEFKNDLVKSAIKLKLDQYLKMAQLDNLVNKGYERIRYQLSLGGESPNYKHDDLHYRKADVALLNLIYPAKLSRLSLEQKRKILSIVRTLAGSYGIKRYLNDNYQSANFWFNDIKTDTSKDSHSKRKEIFIPYTEAQWFFDSWYATSAAIVYKESHDKYYLSESIQFMNRSLAQITGKNMTGANGRPVPAMALPESMNFLHSSGKLQVLPSPIIPLNWSKASMTLMFKHLEPVISDKTNAS
ncbi:glycoside hydrolase family 15 protein [Yersinia enterocolitica]|uniref:glycoside hydrolase family 15 protein n=2 Tax=Yersinia enterocolitica TaxID=630 RepID=UPI00398D4EDB